jgi:hypothetical protein
VANGYDAAYDEELAAYRRRLQREQSNIAYERGRTQQEYGFEDATDPYSRARMLERAYTQRRTATTTGLAARGQLYSGALRGAQAENRFGYEQQTAQTRKEYLDRLRGLTERGVGAQEDFEMSALGARREALGRAIAQGPEAEYPAGGSTTPAQAGWTPQQARGGSPPGPGYQWDAKRYKWVKTGSQPGSGYRWDFDRNRWVKR